jgi:hypothetical protein
MEKKKIKHPWMTKTRPLQFYHSQGDLFWTDSPFNVGIRTLMDYTHCIIILERFNRRSVEGTFNQKKLTQILPSFSIYVSDSGPELELLLYKG